MKEEAVRKAWAEYCQASSLYDRIAETLGKAEEVMAKAWENFKTEREKG